MKLNFFLIICFTAFLTYPLSYDFAIRKAQQGDIKSADEQIRKIMVNCPDEADVLYDAGVLAHRLNNYSHATTYFARAANCSSDQSLQFRCYFNAGNASVDNKDLKMALEYY